MKIEELRSEKREGRARVAATVKWEDCDRPTQEVYFETEEAFAEDLSCNPHAFLVGCIIPAMHYGEERVFMDAEVCPELREGLKTVMGWLRHWYYEPDHPLVRIEAKTQNNLPTPRTLERAGSFFSGGIDSLATLRANRLNYPLNHPSSIKDSLLIYGQNIESDNRPETFERAVAALSEVTRDVGITLIPVYTNVRLLDDSTSFFGYQFHGAILGAVAHAFSQRLTKAFIAGDDIISTLIPWGSHPALNLSYSSCDLRIYHDDLLSTRFEKTKLIADWDVALQNIKVCGPNYPGENCGQCEKCLRTMLALLALGVLDRTPAFPDDVSEELLLSKLRLDNTPYKKLCYQELMVPLAERGRHDLVRVIEYKIAELDRDWQAKLKQLKPGNLRYYYGEIGGWKGMVWRFDHRYLNGGLFRTKRAIFSQA